LKLNLSVGDTLRLQAKGLRGEALDPVPADQVTWVSSDPCVTVDPAGLLTAVAEGIAVVSVQWNGFTDAVKFRVEAPATGVKIVL